MGVGKLYGTALIMRGGVKEMQERTQAVVTRDVDGSSNKGVENHDPSSLKMDSDNSDEDDDGYANTVDEDTDQDIDLVLSDAVNGDKHLDDEFAVDECLGGPMSCPVEYRGESWFDPIASVECSIGLGGVVSLASKEGRDGHMNSNEVTTPLLKRPRGRPKRMASSLPDTLSVPSTPLTSSLEANDTWKTARKIGIKDKDESAVMDELRKSKRVQIQEANNRT